jgi:glucokinase
MVLGIDIGGTTIGFGLVNANGEISHRHKFVTADYSDFHAFLLDLKKHMEERQLLNKIEAVGVGAPNGNFYTGCIDFAPNLDWGEHIAVSKEVQRVFGLPSWLSNDANAAAAGEKQYGGAKLMRDFAVITLGTGVGSGFYVNGEMLQGKYGNGGEFGHVIVEENGRLCGCGNKGCLETYTSVTGLMTTVKKLQEESYSSLLSMDVVLNGKLVADAAEKGDAIAIKAFSITSTYLGKALANLITLFDPEAIFLLGGLAQSGEMIFKETQEVMEANLMPLFKGKVKLLPSELNDADAAILGAAAIAAEQMQD